MCLVVRFIVMWLMCWCCLCNGLVLIIWLVGCLLMVCLLVVCIICCVVLCGRLYLN